MTEREQHLEDAMPEGTETTGASAQSAGGTPASGTAATAGGAHAPSPAGTTTGGGTPPATFTQEDVNRLIAAERRETAKTLDTLRGELKTVRESAEQQGANTTRLLKSILEPEEAPVDAFDAYDRDVNSLPPELEKAAPEVVALYRRHAKERFDNSRTIAQLKAELEGATKVAREAAEGLKTEREARESAELAARESRIDSFVGRFLQEQRVIDPEFVAPYFRQNLVWDAAKNRVAYRTADGDLVDPLPVLQSQVKDTWRQPRVVQGGSGSQGAHAVEIPTGDEISALETERANLVAKGGGDMRAVARVQQLNREIKQKKALLEKSKAA